jgi:diguanylate cyclase (GGDEF)-like protein
VYLKNVAARMERQLRPGDTLARLGGDEFAVLAPQVRNRREVEEIALRLERCFDDSFAVEGNLIKGSASIGVALYPEDARTKDGLLNCADAAMYVAKRARRWLGQAQTVQAEAAAGAPAGEESAAGVISNSA